MEGAPAPGIPEFRADGRKVLREGPELKLPPHFVSSLVVPAKGMSVEVGFQKALLGEEFKHSN